MCFLLSVANETEQLEHICYLGGELITRSSVDREDQRNCRVPYERFFYPTDAGKQPVSEEEEAIYSEADDGKPKPIPVAEFSKYLKKKSENGAIVLREEFKARYVYFIYYSFYLFPFLSYYCMIQ